MVELLFAMLLLTDSFSIRRPPHERQSPRVANDVSKSEDRPITRGVAQSLEGPVFLYVLSPFRSFSSRQDGNTDHPPHQVSITLTVP